MTQEQILDKLELIFIEQLKLTTLHVGMEQKLSDIRGWDSLTQINIVENIESQFNVDFSAGEIVVLKTISDLVKLIQSKI